MSRLGRLVVSLGLDAAEFTGGLTKAEYAAQKMSERIASGSAIAVGALGGLAASATAAVAALDQITGSIAKYQDLADQLGDTTTAVASLQLAADLSGTSMERVASASVKLTASLSKTDEEGRGAASAIKALGFEFDAFTQLSPTEQLRAVAERLAEFENGAGKTAVAVALLGKSGAELIPFLNDLNEAGQRYVELSAEQIAAADEFNKALARVKSEAISAGQALAADLVIALDTIIERFKQGKREGESFIVTLLKQTEIARLLGASGVSNQYSDARRDLAETNQALGRVFLTEQKRLELTQKKADLEKQIAGYLNSPGRGDPRAFGLPSIKPQLDFSDRGTQKAPKAAAPKTTEKFTDAFNEAQDAIEQRIREFFQSQLPESEFKASAEEMKAFEAQAIASFEATRTPAERLEAALEAQKAILKALGPAYEETYERATQGAVQSYLDSLKAGETTFEKLSEFALEAQRNIQGALGDTLLRTMKGDFDSIGQMWLDLLLKMVAQAAAARLNEALFGDGKPGSAGLLTPFLKLIGNLFPGSSSGLDMRGTRGGAATGSNALERDMITLVHKGEAIVPKRYNPALTGGGSGVTINQTINAAPGTSRADLVSAMEQSKRAAVAEVFNAMQRGRVGAY